MPASPAAFLGPCLLAATGLSHSLATGDSLQQAHVPCTKGPAGSGFSFQKPWVKVTRVLSLESLKLSLVVESYQKLVSFDLRVLIQNLSQILFTGGRVTFKGLVYIPYSLVLAS